jgi:DNA-binding beta-propeller fold protein YncE
VRCHGKASPAGTNEPVARRVVAAFALCLVFWAIAVPAASATAVHPYLSQLNGSNTPATYFNFLCGTAVDGNGAIYVAEYGNNVIDVFDESGAYLTQISDAALNGPCGVAVDLSGNLYARNANLGNVVELEPNSFPVTNSTTYSINAHLGESSPGADDGNGVLDSNSATDVAVNPADDHPFVAESSRVQEYDTSGAPVGAAIGIGDIAQSSGLAVRANGDVYVADIGQGRVEIFSGGALASTFNGADSPSGGLAGPSGVAFDPTTNHVYVVDAYNGVVDEFDATGAYQARITPAQTPQGYFSMTDPADVAIDRSGGPADGRVYVTDDFNGVLDVFGPLVNVEPPLVEHLEVTAHDDHSASFQGEVSSGGSGEGQATTYRFECSSSQGGCPGLEGKRSVPTDGSAHLVSDTTEGLVPNTQYTVTLTAENAAGTVHTEVQFHTDASPPTVVTDSANDEGTTHATLRGLVNPHNSPAKFWFEYGTTTAYGKEALLLPEAPHLPPGASEEEREQAQEKYEEELERAENEHGIPFESGAFPNSPHAAILRVDGLQPSTEYHFRLLAENGTGGIVSGEDETFNTTTPVGLEACANANRREDQHAEYLPGCRAYELVSPPDKIGNNVVIASERTQAAADGNAAIFASLGGFGDVRGTGVAVDYMSIRDPAGSPTGWVTHSITPREGPLPIISALRESDPVYEGELSPDLSRGVLRNGWPLTEDPVVAKVGNLYLRDDLRDPGPGSYQLLSSCPACGETVIPSPVFGSTWRERLPHLAGASADFGHVVFESNLGLTADATADGSPETPVNLFESDHGTVRLVGLIPPPDQTSCTGAACEPALNSQAGRGAVNRVYVPRMISADGSRVFFTVPPAAEGYEGALYMREDHQTTVQINASERTDCADHDPCSGTPEPLGTPGPAIFRGASLDGSRAFFESPDVLTDDANSGGQNKLYMYEADAPAGHRLQLIAGGDSAAGNGAVEGVIGASEDGHYAYFVGHGSFVAGQPVGTQNRGVYVWHDGVTRYIGGEDIDTQENVPLFVGLGGYAARLSADGQQLLFVKRQKGIAPGLTGYDQGTCAATGGGGCLELYLYDARSDHLSCVSCAADGSPATSDALDHERVHSSAANLITHLNRTVAGEGRYVFFSTAQALVREDTNGTWDAYVYDTSTGEQRLLSSGTSNAPSYFLEASADGRDAFFATAQRLVGWDVDANYDLYDARVGGGLPEPPPITSNCTGETCQPNVAPPGASTPASSSFQGPGNPSPRRRHHRKRHHRAHRRHHRTVKGDRRTTR